MSRFSLGNSCCLTSWNLPNRIPLILKCFLGTCSIANNVVSQKITLWRVDEIVSESEIVLSEHETIIRAGVTCKKIPCYMHDSACR